MGARCEAPAPGNPGSVPCSVFFRVVFLAVCCLFYISSNFALARAIFKLDEAPREEAPREEANWH